MTNPQPLSSLVTKYSCVYTVAKKCYECGKEWDGKAFTKQPEGAPRLPGICSECLDKEDAKLAALSAPIAPADVELTPPRTVGSVDDDVYPIDRKRLQSGER